MDLDEYLWRKKTTYQKFALLINVSPPTVASIAKRTHTPNLFTASKIMKITKGKVTYKEMISKKDERKLKVFAVPEEKEIEENIPYIP